MSATTHKGSREDRRHRNALYRAYDARDKAARQAKDSHRWCEHRGRVFCPYPSQSRESLLRWGRLTPEVGHPFRLLEQSWATCKRTPQGIEAERKRREAFPSFHRFFLWSPIGGEEWTHCAATIAHCDGPETRARALGSQSSCGLMAQALLRRSMERGELDISRAPVGYGMGSL